VFVVLGRGWRGAEDLLLPRACWAERRLLQYAQNSFISSTILAAILLELMTVVMTVLAFNWK